MPKTTRHTPLSRSHTRSVLSQLPDTARRPSGVTLTLLTEELCPSSVAKRADLGNVKLPGGQRLRSIGASQIAAIACAASYTGPEAWVPIACCMTKPGR